MYLTNMELNKVKQMFTAELARAFTTLVSMAALPLTGPPAHFRKYCQRQASHLIFMSISLPRYKM